MTRATGKGPQFVRHKLEEARTALVDVGTLLGDHRVGDIERAIDRAGTALDDAIAELADAVCDAESALSRL